jgi:DNA-directed RNA polymerase subunit RPC12/RpoP
MATTVWVYKCFKCHYIEQYAVYKGVVNCPKCGTMMMPKEEKK